MQNVIVAITSAIVRTVARTLTCAATSERASVLVRVAILLIQISKMGHDAAQPDMDEISPDRHEARRDAAPQGLDRRISQKSQTFQKTRT